MDRFQHTGGSGMEIYLALRTRHASSAPATGGAEKMAVAILLASPHPPPNQYNTTGARGTHPA